MVHAQPSTVPLPHPTDDRLMVCEPLDPMFCPASPFCTDWDCRCYGPGNNDNKTIAGTLGTTVYDGAKSSLSCACPTYDLSGSEKMMDVTYMPFIDKADHEGNRVMTYECCADWFDGYQCTLWDNTDPAMPVRTMRVYIDTHTHAHMYICVSYVYVYVYVCVYVCAYVCLSVSMCRGRYINIRLH